MRRAWYQGQGTGEIAPPRAVSARLRRLPIAILLVLGLSLGGTAWAQFVPTRPLSSSALEGSHVFGGTVLVTITVTWHTSAARWLMLFDGTAVPSNGAVTPFWCQWVQTAGSQADGSQSYDFTFHPLWFATGVVAALSTNASGCFSLTVDGANDRFDVQIRP